VFLAYTQLALPETPPRAKLVRSSSYLHTFSHSDQLEANNQHYNWLYFYIKSAKKPKNQQKTGNFTAPNSQWVALDWHLSPQKCKCFALESESAAPHCNTKDKNQQF
jgi:hypothetical protein